MNHPYVIGLVEQMNGIHHLGKPLLAGERVEDVVGL